jgi:hypothetical protein
MRRRSIGGQNRSELNLRKLMAGAYYPSPAPVSFLNVDTYRIDPDCSAFASVTSITTRSLASVGLLPQ